MCLQPAPRFRYILLVKVVPLKGSNGDSNRAQQEVNFHVGRISVEYFFGQLSYKKELDED